MISKSTWNAVFLFLLWLSISSCENTVPTLPAPIGSVEALEKLAESYRNTSSQLPTQPRQLAPQDKRKFVENVFTNAGYNYSATLLALAESKLDPFNDHQRDLAQLLFLPVENLSEKDNSNYYSNQEIEAIEKIRKTFR